MEGPCIFTLGSDNGSKVVLGHYEARRSKNDIQFFVHKEEKRTGKTKVLTLGQSFFNFNWDRSNSKLDYVFPLHILVDQSIE